MENKTTKKVPFVKPGNLSKPSAFMQGGFSGKKGSAKSFNKASLSSTSRTRHKSF